MRWALVRHGQTEWNQLRLLQGVTDNVLTAAGRHQASLAGEDLSRCGVWDRIVSSPLIRARQTAERIADIIGTPVLEIADDLAERDFGSAEGASVAGLDDAERQALMNQGESEDSVLARAHTVCVRLAAQHPDERIVLVTHGTLIRTVLDHAYQTSTPRVDNGEVAYVDAALLTRPISLQKS